jgi:hypothetical protein
MDSTRVTRGTGIRRRLVVLAALVALAALCGPPPAVAALDYSTPAAFDALDRGFNRGHGNSLANNDQGALAWGESYVLQAYLLMYQATHRRRYLDKFVAQADRVLAQRDSVRGVTDYLGRSLPAWRTANPYTVGSVVLPDAAGRPVLELRTTLPAASHSWVTVGPGTAAGTFRLDLVNDARANQMTSPCGPLRPAPTASFDDLTMHRGEPSYAVDVVNAAYGSTPMQATAREARPDPMVDDQPAYGTFRFRSLPYVYAVQTGMITYPLVRFVGMVRGRAQLAAVPRYADAADRYLAAAEAAIAIFDPDWRMTADGQGSYAFPRGAPVRFDGADAPLNQSLAMGRTLYELALITGRPDYRAKVAALARSLRGDLAVDPRGSFVWTYSWRRSAVYTGWDLADRPSDNTLWYDGFRSAEDTGHGWIDVSFAAADAVNPMGPPVFTAGDMQAFAATFTRNMAAVDATGAPAVWDHVDGTGCVGDADAIAPAWMPLAAWDPGVYAQSLAVYAARQPAPSAASLFGCASLVRFAAGAPQYAMR